MDNRAKAVEIIKALDALVYPSLKERQEALDAETTEAYMAAHPRKRKVPKIDTIRAWEGASEIFERHAAKYDKDSEDYRATRDRLKEELAELILDGTFPRPGEHPVQFAKIHSASYSTQGFGSIRYAKNAAEQKQDIASYYNIPSALVREDVRRKYQTFSSTPSANFTVMVWVEDPEVDLPLLQHCVGPDLVEWVRRCWKRGINPRVHNPYLPHGFEAEHGLDFFGNRTTEGA